MDPIHTEHTEGVSSVELTPSQPAVQSEMLAASQPDTPKAPRTTSLTQDELTKISGHLEKLTFGNRISGFFGRSTTYRDAEAGVKQFCTDVGLSETTVKTLVKYSKADKWDIVEDGLKLESRAKTSVDKWAKKTMSGGMQEVFDQLEKKLGALKDILYTSNRANLTVPDGKGFDGKGVAGTFKKAVEELQIAYDNFNTLANAPQKSPQPQSKVIEAPRVQAPPITKEKLTILINSFSNKIKPVLEEIRKNRIFGPEKTGIVSADQKISEARKHMETDLPKAQQLFNEAQKIYGQVQKLKNEARTEQNQQERRY